MLYLIHFYQHGEIGIWVAKGLDRFVILEGLLAYVQRFHSQMVNSPIFYHMPIILHVEVEGGKVKYSFKFNHSWLREEDFLS